MTRFEDTKTSCYMHLFRNPLRKGSLEIPRMRGDDVIKTKKDADHLGGGSSDWRNL